MDSICYDPVLGRCNSQSHKPSSLLARTLQGGRRRTAFGSSPRGRWDHLGCGGLPENIWHPCLGRGRMEAHLQPASWDWIRAVVGSSFVILMITSGIMLPLERLFEPRKLGRLPAWSRWLLVLPAAFLSGLIAEVVPRMLFALMEIIVNHELLFRPGFDFLIWQLWGPLLFVAGGVQMAPRLKFVAFLVVGGLKIGVATTNFVRDLSFVHGGGPWSAVDPMTNSPVWWNAIVYTVCIASISAFGFFLAKQAMAKGPQYSITPVR